MAPNSVLYRIAIRFLTLLALVLPCAAFAGGGVGTVSHLSGPLFAKRADGTTRTLAVNSVVEQGDTLITEKRTYGRIKFADGGEVTLRPGTTFAVERFAYDKGKPGDDSAVLNLVKGSLRAVTGQIGKRGDQEAYRMKTHSTTIGVRGTSFDLKVCQDNCPGLANGIYFLVIEGSIQVTNAGGTQTFGAGQYGYVKDNNTLPMLLPTVPKLDLEIPQLEKSACGVR